MAGIITKKKAKEILRHGEIGGVEITKKQRGFFGLIAGTPRKKLKRKIRKKSLLT